MASRLSSSARTSIPLMVAMALPCLSFATSMAPDFVPCDTLGRVATAAKSPSTRQPALLVLEQLLKGRLSQVALEDIEKVGLRASDLASLAVDPGTTASCAARKLGATDLEEASSILSHLTRVEAPSVPAYNEAKMAFQDIAFRKISGTAEQEGFLSSLIGDPNTLREDGALQYWALEKMCDLGFARANTLIREWVDANYPRQTADRIAGSCAARIRALVENRDRVKALTSILFPVTGPHDMELSAWAVGQLALLNSEQGDHILRLLVSEIRKLPGDSVESANMRLLEDSVGLLLDTKYFR